jgi:hypothetical protein
MYAAACDTFLQDAKTSPDSAASILKMILMNSVDPKPGFDTLYQSGGRLNVFNAVVSIQQYGNCSTVGLGNYAEEPILQLYPNPSSKEVNLRYSKAEKDAEIWISDLAGRLIREIPTNGKEQRIDLSDLKEGIYFLTIVSGTQKSKAQKLIKTN